MDNKNLIEEIKRIHKILGVDSKILFESENELSEAPVTSPLAKKLASILVSDVIKYGGRDYTRAEVRAIMNKVGTKALNADEKEILKIATSRVIGKDASKTVLDTISKSFVSDLKAITDDAVADATIQEFKALFRSIMKKEDADILEDKIKKEVKNIVRPVRPEDLNVEKFKQQAKAIDGYKIKDLTKVTNEYIATVRAENPGMTTTEIMKKIIESAPPKTWTPEFIMKIAGQSFNFSKEIAAQLSNFMIKTGGKPFKWAYEHPVKTFIGSISLVSLYIAIKGIYAYGVEKDFAAFRGELGDILAKYPCLDGYILPMGGYYDLVMSDNKTKYPAIWENNRLWYIKDTVKKEKISEVKC